MQDAETEHHVEGTVRGIVFNADRLELDIGRASLLRCSPADLDARGRPRSFADLNHHVSVGFDRPEKVAEGLAERGLSVFTEDMAQDAGLEPVLTDQFRIDVTTWLVTHRELNTNRRIRLVFDAIAAHLQSQKKNGRS